MGLVRGLAVLHVSRFRGAGGGARACWLLSLATTAAIISLLV